MTGITPIYLEMQYSGAYGSQSSEGRLPPEPVRLTAYSDRSRDCEFDCLIKPMESITREAMNYHGITNARVQRERGFLAVWKDFVRWAEMDPTSQVVLVGHQLYDVGLKVLRGHCEYHNEIFPNDWKCFSTDWLLNALRDCKGLSLDEVCQDLGLGHARPHAGGKDVYRVMSYMIGAADKGRVYHKMLDRHCIRAVKEEILSVSLSRPIVYDLESTGLFPDKKDPNRELPRITEIAAKDPTLMDQEGEFQALVNPEKEIPSNVQEITGITNAMVGVEPTWKEVWPRFRAFVELAYHIGGDSKKGNRWQVDVVLISHNNYGYDLKLLKAESDRIGVKFPGYWRAFCTLYLCRSLRLKRPHKLQVLRERYEISLEGKAHRAMADVKANIGVLGWFMGKASWEKVFKAMHDSHPIRAVANVIIEANGGTKHIEEKKIRPDFPPSKESKRKRNEEEEKMEQGLFGVQKMAEKEGVSGAWLQVMDLFSRWDLGDWDQLLLEIREFVNPEEGMMRVDKRPRIEEIFEDSKGMEVDEEEGMEEDLKEADEEEEIFSLMATGREEVHKRKRDVAEKGVWDLGYSPTSKVERKKAKRRRTFAETWTS